MVATVSHAAGGGGGGGSLPSQSAPRYDAAKEYKKGMSALEAQDYKTAAKSFKRVLSVVKKDANTNYLLGFSYFKQQDFKKAAKAFKRATRYDKSMFLARRDLAITQIMLGKKEKAETELEKLISAREECINTSCPNIEQLEKAIKKVKHALQSHSQVKLDIPDVNYANSEANDQAYISAIGLINNKQYQLAIDSLVETAFFTGPHPDILTYIGFAYRKLKQFDLAEKYYSQALAIAPNHLGAIEYSGELMLEKGNLSGAKKKLAKLDSLCNFGCYEAEELRHWIQANTNS